MKAYLTEVSGEFLCQLFRPGILSPYREQLEVESLLPQKATLVGVRVTAFQTIEMLWLSDEPGEIPEATDIWSCADRTYVTIRRSVLAPTETVPV